MQWKVTLINLQQVKKGGKGSIVENITVDEKNAAKVAEAKRESKEQSKEIEEK